jgi:hypothetical protein
LWCRFAATRSNQAVALSRVGADAQQAIRQGIFDSGQLSVQQGEGQHPQAGTAKAVFGGWQFNGIVTLSSGTPFTISSGRDAALNFNTTRANVIGDPNLPSDRPQADLIQRYYNPDAFAIPANGTLGNSPRNFLIGPGSKNVDLSLFRTFMGRQRFGVQARLEAFNAFNFVNFGNPRSNIGVANPGRIETAGDPRILQVGLRTTF